ncbi:hypothetical protein BFJ69_g16953 [Fusarium oxysporum]|uniref:Uncharacterized protein n=1 Tax=Fusarium oxysporum TaxID=5507 RepID=A0A420M9M5_FUSOX|nr:hypothetical protein BFJ69_g16953 [Fusarium oxysporum]
MSEFTTMSEFSDDLPTTIDTTAEIDWLDETPDVPEFQKEVSEIAEENKSVLETVDWTQILDEQDQRRVAITIEYRQARIGYLYSHLTNPEINWELNRKTVCRVKDFVCYGKSFPTQELSVETHCVSCF